MTDAIALERWVDSLPTGARDAFRAQVWRFEQAIRDDERSLPAPTLRFRCEVCGQKLREGWWREQVTHPECEALL